MKKIVFKPDLCTGCEVCALICSYIHLGGFNTQRACLDINHFNKGMFNSAQFCEQCEDAVCSEVCPVDALTVDKDKGYVTFDADKCIGCGKCEEHCPFNMIKVQPESNKAFKCDMCGYCVDYCPNDALGVFTK